MPKLRLILKVPDSYQTGPDTWQDTTRYSTFDMPCPPDLEARLNRWHAVVVGAEVLGGDDATSE